MSGHGHRGQARKTKIDVLVANEGSVFVFNPLTQVAQEWFEQNVQIEDYQRFGPSIVVEHRFAWPLAQGLIDAGFILQ
jgi:hypothetical protein